MAQAAYYPITIIKGDTFSQVFRVNIKDCDTNALTPVDLSSVVSVESKLLDLDNNAEIVVFTATVTNAATGEITISLTSAQTDVLVGVVGKKITEKIGSYYVRLIYNNDTETTKIRGSVSLTSIEGI